MGASLERPEDPPRGCSASRTLGRGRGGAFLSCRERRISECQFIVGRRRTVGDLRLARGGFGAGRAEPRAAPPARARAPARALAREHRGAWTAAAGGGSLRAGDPLIRPWTSASRRSCPTPLSSPEVGSGGRCCRAPGDSTRPRNIPRPRAYFGLGQLLLDVRFSRSGPTASSGSGQLLADRRRMAMELLDHTKPSLVVAADSVSHPPGALSPAASRRASHCSYWARCCSRPSIVESGSGQFGHGETFLSAARDHASGRGSVE